MNKLSKISRDSIGYLYSSDSLVTSSPLHLVTSFLKQRLRWAGKWKSNISFGTRAFALVVWLFHLVFIAMGCSALFGFITWKLFIILAGAKDFRRSTALDPGCKILPGKMALDFFPRVTIHLLLLRYLGRIHVADPFTGVEGKSSLKRRF
ncbi:MAG: hypothetical protein WDO15_02330 [Bacteroidota bacterium]